MIQTICDECNEVIDYTDKDTVHLGISAESPKGRRSHNMHLHFDCFVKLFPDSFAAKELS